MAVVACSSQHPWQCLLVWLSRWLWSLNTHTHTCVPHSVVPVFGGDVVKWWGHLWAQGSRFKSHVQAVALSPMSFVSGWWTECLVLWMKQVLCGTDSRTWWSTSSERMLSKQNPVQISPLLGWAAELKSYVKVEVGSSSLIVCTVSVVSLAGAATSIIFVVTKVCLL